MIKPEEIRIGNLLKWGDESEEIIKVTGIYIDEEIGDIVKFEGGGAQLDEFIAIPLTEEILIKAGFESWGTVICNDYEQFHRFVLHNAIDGSSNFEVHIINSMYGGNYVREFAYSIDSNKQHINCTNYLHNLQNAFHQASGTELKIEL